MTDGRDTTGMPPRGANSAMARDAALLHAATELFLQEPAHDRDEIRRYEELVGYLLTRVPLADRIFVAERLATRIDAPVSVLRALGKDKIEVARLVLARSPVLGPSDLLAIVAGTGSEHHKLIATRPGLSTDVFQALRSSGDPGLMALIETIETNARRGLPRTQQTEAMPRAEIAPAVADFQDEEDVRDEGRPNAQSNRLGAMDWFAQRETFRLRSNRLGQDNFLRLDRNGRLKVMAELAVRPGRRSTPNQSIDPAFRSILGAAQIVGFARTGQRKALVDAIAGGLGVESEFVMACLNDGTGEPLAVLLKNLGLENSQAQQVFLLATASVGRDVTAFFHVCDIYAGMEPMVAETLLDSWREERHPPVARHEPLFAENNERRRSMGIEPSRESQSPAIQRNERLSRG